MMRKALLKCLAALAAVFLVAHFRFGGRSALSASFLVLGFLAADTPVGAVFLSLAVAALGVRRLLRNAGHLETPEETPFAAALMPWRITLVFLSGLAAGIALEVDAFARLDGPLAFGWTWGDYAVEAPIAYVRALLASCTPAGLAIMVALTVVPVVLEAELLSRASDDERHLVYVYGAAFAVLGFVAFSQLSPAKSLWFWTKGGEAGCVTDGVIRCAALLLCALSVAWALAVFVIELYLRNFRRIETLRYPDAAEAKDAAPALASARRLQRITRAVFLLEPVLVLGCVVPGRAQRLERDMQSVVADAAIETAEGMGRLSFLPAAVGYSVGFLFLLVLDFVIPQPEELLTEEKNTSGGMRKIRMMVLAVTLHNIPEGMAVGVAFAAVLVEKNPAMASAAMALSVGIAIQNFPEGAIVSMPLAGAGMSKGKALLWGVLSGAVELLGAGVMLAASVWLAPAMPYFLSFAAGAMFYVVVEELIPEMEDGVRQKIGAVSFAVGFLVMMILDVLLG